MELGGVADQPQHSATRRALMLRAQPRFNQVPPETGPKS
jgi:hypothetical protein